MGIGDWAAGIVWIFRGNPNCSLCSNVSGYYGGQYPPRRPHANCACEISFAILYGDYVEVFKNKQDTLVDEYRIDYSTQTFTNTSDTTVSTTYRVDEMAEGEVTVSATVDKAFGVGGKYKESERISQEFDVELEPGESVTFQPYAIMQTWNLCADRYWRFVLDETGEEIDVFMGHECDMITVVDDVGVDIR